MGEDITRTIRPQPPSFNQESDPQQAIAKIAKHLQDLALYDNKVNDIISSDFIVRGSQVEGLTIDDLLRAQHIITELLQVGTEANVLTLDNTPRLRVYDGNRYRVVLGKQGAEYGIWIHDADGNPILTASGLGTNVVTGENVVDGAITVPKLGSDVVFNSLDSIVNLNTAGDGTIHTYGADNSNAPTTNPGMLTTHGDIQYAYDYETGRIYKRTRSAGVWSAWADITTGTVQLPPIASQITDPNTAAGGSFHVLSVAAGPQGWNSFGVLVTNLVGFSEGILSTVTNESEEMHTLPDDTTVTVTVGDKIQNYRDYFSGRVFQRVQVNRVWQHWEEVTAVPNSIAAQHLHGRLITADKLDITSVHRFIQDYNLSNSRNVNIWKFNTGWGPSEGVIDLTNGPTNKGFRIQGWLVPLRNVVYEENKLFEVKEGETVTFELSYFQTHQFDSNYGDVRLKYTLVDSTTATTRDFTLPIFSAATAAVNTWHFRSQKVKITRPQGWTRRASFIKDITLEYTGKPVASSVTTGTFQIAGLQVTRAALGIYIGDGEIQTPHLAAGVVTADKVNTASLSSVFATIQRLNSITINASQIVAGTIEAERLTADVKNVDLLYLNSDYTSYNFSGSTANNTRIADISITLANSYKNYNFLEFIFMEEAEVNSVYYVPSIIQPPMPPDFGATSIESPGGLFPIFQFGGIEATYPSPSTPGNLASAISTFVENAGEPGELKIKDPNSVSGISAYVFRDTSDTTIVTRIRSSDNRFNRPEILLLAINGINSPGTKTLFNTYDSEIRSPSEFGPTHRFGGARLPDIRIKRYQFGEFIDNSVWRSGDFRDGTTGEAMLPQSSDFILPRP